MTHIPSSQTSTLLHISKFNIKIKYEQFIVNQVDRRAINSYQNFLLLEYPHTLGSLEAGDFWGTINPET